MLYLVKMTFKRALSYNRGESRGYDFGRAIVHSDTLFSGIINQWVKLPGSHSIDALVSNLNSGSPPFKLSSAFPFFSENYYLPMPISCDEKYYGISKIARYLELRDFLELANGRRDILRRLPERNPVSEFIATSTSPRVTVDRITCVSNFYDNEELTIRTGGGLYYILDVRDETLENTLKTCISLLGESGIGSDRTVGYGVFSADIRPIRDDSEWSELFVSRKGDHISYYTLALCCPEHNTAAREAFSYDIIHRTGWVLSSSSNMQPKRRECRMFAEGSLFKTQINGHIADVTPSIFKSQHNVYRYGLGMMVAGSW